VWSALNPRSSEAWYRLGRLSARTFNFDERKFLESLA
jgi:hypothetical protein